MKQSLCADLHNLKKTRSGRQSTQTFQYQQPQFQRISKALQNKKKSPNQLKIQQKVIQDHERSAQLRDYKDYKGGLQYRSDRKVSQKYKVQNFRNMMRQSYGILKKMIYCFPIMDTQLTPKRVQVISELIHKQGGFVIPLRESGQLHLVNYVLVSRKASIQAVEQKIKDKIKCNAILDFNYVQQCLNQQKIVDIEPYLLKSYADDHSKQEITKYISIKSQSCSRKIQKSISKQIAQEQTANNTLIVDNNASKSIQACQKYNSKNQEDEQKQTEINLKRHHQENQDKDQSFDSKILKKVKQNQNDDHQQQHQCSISEKANRTDSKMINYDPNQSDQQFFDKKSCVIPRGKTNFGEYLCTRQTLNSNFKMNNLIVEELTKMLKIYEAQKDQGRICAYLKATSVIRHLPKQIKNQRDIENLTGIGQRMKEKIKQIIKTGKLHKLEQMNKSQIRVSCGQLIEVWGIGPNKANQLYKKGIRTINDLRQQLKKAPDLLNSKQTIGLKYHEEFNQRIPRQKVTRMFQYFKTVLYKVAKSTQVHLMQVCGSYRRNKPTCGDIDIIITRKDGVSDKGLVYMIVKQLYDLKFLTDHLTIPKHKKEYSSTNYMGVCQFEQTCHHRIDIRFYPLQQYSFALMYFTGSMMFNRSIRLHAITLGLQLSDLGVVPKENKERIIWNRQIPICYTQKDIFDLMGLPYRSPEQRDI